MSIQLTEQLIQEHINLPTLPQVVARINALVDDPEVGVREIGAAVGEDAPIAARVLKIANSAYFGLRERVLTTEHATAVLGVRMLRTVAMQASVISHFEHLDGLAEFDLKALWKHAILTGQVSSAIVKRCRAKLGISPDEAQVIGLLHDIGKVLMLEAAREPFLAAMRAARTGKGPEHVCEERSLGFHHAHVGALVATHWGLPVPVSEAIQYHHDLDGACTRDPAAALIAFANLLVHAIERKDFAAAGAVLDGVAQDMLGIRRGDVPQIVEFAARTSTLIEV